MAKKHRNLFREALDTSARERAAQGLEPLMQREWAELFSVNRPAGSNPIAESSVARYASNRRGIARRIGLPRRFMLEMLGIDYTEYLDAWGSGPEAK